MERINSLSRAEALAAFKACCGSAKYAEVACYAPPVHRTLPRKHSPHAVHAVLT